MDPSTWYYGIPVVTRVYLTAAVLTSVAVALDFVSPFTLYFNVDLILRKREGWRIVSSFLYFGTLGFDFAWHLFFFTRYSSALEENTIRRTSQYLWMLFISAVLLTLLAPVLKLQFLGVSMTSIILYVWSRTNPHVRLSLMGVLQFNAPFLPYVMILFSLLLGQSVMEDVVGLAIGHLYYFFEYVFPEVARIRGYSVRRWLEAPKFLRVVCGEEMRIEEENH